MDEHRDYRWDPLPQPDPIGDALRHSNSGASTYLIDALNNPKRGDLGDQIILWVDATIRKHMPSDRKIAPHVRDDLLEEAISLFEADEEPQTLIAEMEERITKQCESS